MTLRIADIVAAIKRQMVVVEQNARYDSRSAEEDRLRELKHALDVGIEENLDEIARLAGHLEISGASWVYVSEEETAEGERLMAGIGKVPPQP